MNFFQLMIVGSLSFFQFTAMSAEVDQFTRNNEVLSDSSELLNVKANLAVVNSIQSANQLGKGCSEKDLYKELRGYFANHLKGKLVIDILSNPSIEKRNIQLKESIFQDWSAWDGVGLGITIISKKGVTMSEVMRVGDYEMGVDKLEHMFGQGFSYFEKNYHKGKGEMAALKRGILLERTLLGGPKFINGVFSYGDLSANFNGMRFWNHMLQLHVDVLGPEFNIGPYITCENNLWVKAKEIDFKNYIDDSFDESINCSKFPSKSTAKKFTDRLTKMGTSCPLDQKRLDDVTVKYKHLAKWIINPDGAGEYKPIK